MNTPRVSIVLRSHNDGPLLARTLAALDAQTFRDFEILSFDNASDDETARLLDARPQVRRFTVPKGAYVSGRVLNWGAREARADTLVFNNADAVPLDAHWLERLVAPILEGDADIVYARQVCRPDADPWVRLDYARAFGDMPPDENFFSMASSAARKSVFADTPFDERLRCSEDVAWALAARKKGARVRYVPSALAEHSHNYAPEQARRRFGMEGRDAAFIYGAPPSRCAQVRGLFGAWARDLKYLAGRGLWRKIPAALRLRWIQKHATYAAWRRAFETEVRS